MHDPRTKHTIDIFVRMSQNLPPLVPENIEKEIRHALEHMQTDYTVRIDDVENIVISLGKKIWAYWKAFQEIYDMDQGKIGEKFFIGKLPPELKRKYQEFKEHGGTYGDLYTGDPLVFFDEDHRLKIMEACVETDREVRQHTRQSVVSVERKTYENLIISFQEILDDIEKRLGNLKTLAEDEEEHPQLAEEIRDQIRAFEFGLCLLGPNTRHGHVRQTDDFFEERRATKKIHSSI